jgi:FkbM family methyltransferase
MSSTPRTSRELELEDVFRQMEQEPFGELRAREQNAFDKIAGPYADRLVLFGAGPLGKAVLAGLRKQGVEPLAFADNNQQLWCAEVSGLPVLSPADAVRQHGNAACFVVTIYQGSQARRQLASMGCAHVAPFALLFWKYADAFIPHSGIDLPHRIREHSDEIRRCYSVLADHESRRELTEQLLWRYWFDYSVLSPPLDDTNIYFPLELVSPTGEDVFVDCGAFDGDTIRSLSEHWRGKFRHVFALEPDPMNRTALASNMEKIGLGPRITIMPFAVANANATVFFDAFSSMGSHLTTTDSGSSVECRRLNDIEWPFTPTYIKMDVEGAEIEALVGAAELVKQHQPVLAVCTYHRSEHLWQIPNLIRSIAPEYNLFLRRYGEDCWEGVCYAIPNHRLKTI